MNAWHWYSLIIPLKPSKELPTVCHLSCQIMRYNGLIIVLPLSLQMCYKPIDYHKMFQNILFFPNRISDWKKNVLLTIWSIISLESNMKVESRSYQNICMYDTEAQTGFWKLDTLLDKHLVSSSSVCGNFSGSTVKALPPYLNLLMMNLSIFLGQKKTRYLVNSKWGWFWVIVTGEWINRVNHRVSSNVDGHYPTHQSFEQKTQELCIRHTNVLDKGKNFYFNSISFKHT